VEIDMRHEQPHGDNTGMTTNELACALMNRLDAPNCLHSLLALMVVMSDELTIERRCRMACSLRDAADMIEERVMPCR
jgi:hypothetical protein